MCVNGLKFKHCHSGFTVESPKAFTSMMAVYLNLVSFKASVIYCKDAFAPTHYRCKLISVIIPSNWNDCHFVECVFLRCKWIGFVKIGSAMQNMKGWKKAI